MNSSDRLPRRASDGPNLTGCLGPVGTESPSPAPHKDVDHVSKLLDVLRVRMETLEERHREDRNDLEAHKADVARVLADHSEEHARLHAELANTKTRLACAERALGERHREGR